jgi:tRNA A37 N6-isopentenylltransferase MiaA
MTNEMLNPSQVFQLKEGLLLRIKQLEENIAACKAIGQDEYVKYWEQSLDEAKIVEKAIVGCYNVTLK